MADIPERDWKLLRQLKPVALERLCARILKEAANITAAPGPSHDRFLKLYDMIIQGNDEVAIAFDDHRRSTALPKIVQIHSRGLFTEEEFAQFSEETRQLVSAITHSQ
jgi:hypothetical protein